jgi:thiol-disulfide isomerase/thioredoxin
LRESAGLDGMIRKALVAAVLLGGLLVAGGYVAYVLNPAPAMAPISAAQAAHPDRPYVVKLHAQWCPVCMTTKGVWSQVEAAYSQRVNLVVLDFTNQATTDAGRNEARRLGLDTFFDEYAGTTGVIAVLDGRTREVRAAIKGSRDFAEYRAAIDAALAGGAR